MLHERGQESWIAGRLKAPIGPGDGIVRLMGYDMLAKLQSTKLNVVDDVQIHCNIVIDLWRLHL